MTAPATTSASKSRRALLAGALGGLGVAVANALGRATPTRAGVDGDVVLGSSNNVATTTTAITNTTTDNTALVGDSNLGIGLLGRSSVNYGIAGTSITGTGAFGSSDSATGSVGWSRGNGTGLLGVSTGPDVLINGKAKTGVYGRAGQDATSKGVWGSSPAGHGLHGETTSGVGLFATATSGYALRTNGRLRADKVSGVATIEATNARVTVTPGVNVTSTSFVLLTPKVNIGSRALWFTTNATANTFTIRMSSARSSGTKVAWLLMG